MYEYIQGRLKTVFVDYIVIETGGIGYKIYAHRTDKIRCLPVESEIKVFIDLIIREDSHTLYGFSSDTDRDLFRLLLQVNGIGPKVAMNIMSSSSAEQLSSALHSKDVSSLSKIPGIGKKLAERLIVELHERIIPLCTTGGQTSATALHLDACTALQTLGLSSHEARKIITHVQNAHPHITTVEEMVQQALIFKRSCKI